MDSVAAFDSSSRRKSRVYASAAASRVRGRISAREAARGTRVKALDKNGEDTRRNVQRSCHSIACDYIRPAKRIESAL